MDFDLPLRLRHTKHYAVFRDEEGIDFARTGLQGVYQTARQAFITLKRLRLNAHDRYIYAAQGQPGTIHDNGIGLLRTLDGSYVGWGYQFCIPGERVLITLRVKATFVYHEELDMDINDEPVGLSLPDDFTEWQLHCEIPYDEIDKELEFSAAKEAEDDSSEVDSVGISEVA